MRVATIMACCLLVCGSTRSQEPQESADRVGNEPPVGEQPAPPPLEEPADREWSLSASLYTYFIPSERDYVQPTFGFDYRWLHFEGRYNYESRDTGSTWLGYNFEIGDELKFEATPMVGAVFGHQVGVAPGYKFSLNYWKLELYSEGEYLFDVETTSDSFFYTWSELTISPLEWLRFGLVTQRTRAYETDVDVQRGLLLGFSYKALDFTTHVFNLGWDDPTLVFSLGLSF